MKWQGVYGEECLGASNHKNDMQFLELRKRPGFHRGPTSTLGLLLKIKIKNLTGPIRTGQFSAPGTGN